MSTITVLCYREINTTVDDSIIGITMMMMMIDGDDQITVTDCTVSFKVDVVK